MGLGEKGREGAGGKNLLTRPFPSLGRPVINLTFCPATLLENLTDAAIALCDEIFDHFPLFDETLRHTELPLQ